MNAINKNLLSIVVPMFNEEGNVEALYEELLITLQNLKYFTNFEIVTVNDGSQDNTLLIAKKIAARDSRFKIISFSRNFGHEQATYAGIHHAQGEAVALIDADKQNPPELILEFEKEYLNGFHIVYGQKTQREKETIIKKITATAFYYIFKYLTKIDLPPNVGDFCLMSKKAVDYFKKMPERTLFIRGLIYWSGLTKKAIPFVARPRYSGTSKYTYSKLIIFALENIISFSTTPIYAIIFMSFFIIISCFIGAGVALFMRLSGYVAISGWTSLIITLLFISGTILFTLGILGLYIGKIFQEIKQRPIYLINEKVNFTIQSLQDTS